MKFHLKWIRNPKFFIFPLPSLRQQSFFIFAHTICTTFSSHPLHTKTFIFFIVFVVGALVVVVCWCSFNLFSPVLFCIYVGGSLCLHRWCSVLVVVCSLLWLLCLVLLHVSSHQSKCGFSCLCPFAWLLLHCNCSSSEVCFLTFFLSYWNVVLLFYVFNIFVLCGSDLWETYSPWMVLNFASVIKIIIWSLKCMKKFTHKLIFLLWFFFPESNL